MQKLNLYIDCTDLIETNLSTGIQRVSRNIVDFRFTAENNLGIICQPVYYNEEYGFIKVSGYKKNIIKNSVGYLYSVRLCLSQFRRFKRLIKATIPFLKFQEWIDRHWQGAIRFLLISPLFLIVAPIVAIAIIYAIFIPLRNHWKPNENDILIIPGSSWWTCNLQNGIKEVKVNMGRVAIIIYDLIPVTHPYVFTERSVKKFKSSLPFVITNTDLFIAISQTTENTLKQYLIDNISSITSTTTRFLLGAELDLIDQTLHVRKSLETLFLHKQQYLCVGTIEPRKNHSFLLDAFDKIWEHNHKIHLCVIGRYGWKSEMLQERITSHPLLGKNLSWFSDLNDTELFFCYKNAKALIFPSIIEGFGLPIIEALHFGCPVIASDIPVFREIGNDRCSYFSLDSPDGLVSLIDHFERFDELPGVVQSDDFKWISWEDSALEFYKIILRHFQET